MRLVKRLWNWCVVSLIWILYRIALASNSRCDAAGLLVELGSHRAKIEDAQRAYLQARELALRNGCAEAAARSAVGLAYVLLTAHSYGEAGEILGTELGRIRALHDPRLLAEALLKSGVISDKQGNQHDASASWREAAEVSRTAGYDFGYAEAITNLGGIAYRAQQDDEARRYWLEALDLSRRRHDALNIAELDLYLGIIAMRSGDVDEAKSRFAESWELYDKNGRPELAEKAASYLHYPRPDAG